MGSSESKPPREGMRRLDFFKAETIDLFKEDVATTWANERLAHKVCRSHVPHRLSRLQQMYAARALIEAFIAQLFQGNDPWEESNAAICVAAITSDEEVAKLVVEGFKRRGFVVRELMDRCERYHRLGKIPPRAFVRWAIVLEDPMLSVLP